MNTAEYIVKRLEELGVSDFFGLPGDYNFNLIRAVENNTGVKWVGCTNELNAGYAADGYARIRGYGAIITTYGVGELSAMNAIAGCMSENIPVVHIVGIPSTKHIEKKELMHHNLQETNYKAFSEAFKQVVAATAFLTRDNAKMEIDRVLKVLIKEKKPVYIAIPDDIATMEISDKVPTLEWSSDKNTLNQAAEKIVKKIANSLNPVIIGDVLIKRFDALIEYKEFVVKSGIPVSNFLMGMNIINNNYEKYLGGYFAGIRNPIAQKYIEETDCLIAVGTIYSDINSFGCKLPYKIKDHIAIYGTYTYIEGKLYDNIKMSDLLDTVTKMIESKNIEINKPNIGYKQKAANEEALTCDYIYPRIQEYIKENDIIITDIGTVTHGVSQMKVPEHVELEFQALWGSIGWATPAALGASIAKPQSRIILITGEGAHQITALEIGTMLKYGLKPVIIVVNNNGYSIERLLANDTDAKFNDIVQINYAKFARVFEGDVWATKTSTQEDFDKALKVTQIMNKMCYIEACIDKLDVPQLSRDMIFAVKPDSVSQEIKSTKKTDEDINEIIQNTTSSNFEYETIVHKGIIMNENTEQEDIVNE